MHDKRIQTFGPLACLWVLMCIFYMLKSCLKETPVPFPPSVSIHTSNMCCGVTSPFFGVHVGVEILSLPPTYFRVCVCVWRGVPFLIPFLCAFSIAFYLPPPCACVSMPRPWIVMKVAIISYLLHSYCTWHCTLQ